MDKYTANRYIALKNQIAAGGGSVPQDLIDEVNALDTTVNGDETQDPPIVGLVDVVGDLENSVENLDVTVNGDSTTTPATPGLVDIVGDLDLTVNGDSTTTPATPGLVDRVEALENGSLTVNELDFTATTDQYGGVATALSNAGNTIIAAKMVGASGFVLYYQGGDDVWHLEAFTSIAPSVQVISNQSIRFIVKYI